MSDGKFKAGNRGAAKLTARDIQQMRHDYATGTVTQGDLCRKYNISVIQVGRILRRECWRGVPDFELTAFDLDASARRLLAIQEEVNRQSATAKMQEALREERETGRAGDKLLDELTGDLNGTGTGQGGS